LPGGMRVIRR